MRYPKPLMSIRELVEMGYSKTDLYHAAHCDESKYYIIPTKGKGKIRFDTEQWEKHRKHVLTGR